MSMSQKQVPSTSNDSEFRVYCPVCWENYDNKRHVPFLLASETGGCGHTACSSCVSVLKKTDRKCALCRAPFSEKKSKNKVNEDLKSACAVLESQKKLNKALRDSQKTFSSSIENMKTHSIFQNYTYYEKDFRCKTETHMRSDFEGTGTPAKTRNWQLLEVLNFQEKMRIENEKLSLENAMMADQYHSMLETWRLHLFTRRDQPTGFSQRKDVENVGTTMERSGKEPEKKIGVEEVMEKMRRLEFE